MMHSKTYVNAFKDTVQNKGSLHRGNRTKNRTLLMKLNILQGAAQTQLFTLHKTIIKSGYKYVVYNDMVIKANL